MPQKAEKPLGTDVVVKMIKEEYERIVRLKLMETFLHRSYLRAKQASSHNALAGELSNVQQQITQSAEMMRFLVIDGSDVANKFIDEFDKELYSPETTKKTPKNKIITVPKTN